MLDGTTPWFSHNNNPSFHSVFLLRYEIPTTWTSLLFAASRELTKWDSVSKPRRHKLRGGVCIVGCNSAKKIHMPACFSSSAVAESIFTSHTNSSAAHLPTLRLLHELHLAVSIRGWIHFSSGKDEKVHICCCSTAIISQLLLLVPKSCMCTAQDCIEIQKCAKRQSQI